MTTPARDPIHRVTGVQPRSGRTPPFALRLVSGLRLGERVELQTERDTLIHRLGQIDGRFRELTAERRAIVVELAALRDTLYPVVAWAKGRRPPEIDHAPILPAPHGAPTLSGRELRSTCLAILRHHGALTLIELHALLHRYGYLIGARRPVTALSDAMAYEVERGRARRVERGTYEATGRPPRWAKPDLPLDLPTADHWIDQRPAQLDPAREQDPAAWIITTG